MSRVHTNATQLSARLLAFRTSTEGCERQIRQKLEVLWLVTISKGKLVHEDLKGSWVLLKRLHNVWDLFNCTLVEVFVVGAASRRLDVWEVTYCLEVPNRAAKSMRVVTYTESSRFARR